MSWAKVAVPEAPVEFRADTPQIGPNEAEKTQLVVVFASAITIGVAKRRPDGRGRPSLHGYSLHELNHVSRQSPNSRGRKRAAQSPRGIQARDRREIRSAILYHQLRREGCTTVSLRGMGADRAEAGRALHFQSYEEEVSRPHELLGSAGGNGRSGPALNASATARVGADQGRSVRDRAADVPGSSQPGAVPPGDRGQQVHA